MMRLLLLLAACAAPTAALPFGFGRRKGEVLASLHEIAEDLADLETTPVVPNAPPCGELPAATPPDETWVVTFKAGLTPASPSPAGPAGEPPNPLFCFDFKCGAPPPGAVYAVVAAGPKTAETPCKDPADCGGCFTFTAEQPVTDEHTAAGALAANDPTGDQADTGCVPFDQYMRCIQNDACRAKLAEADPLTPRDEAEMMDMGVPPNLAELINEEPPMAGPLGGTISQQPGFSVNPAADDLPT